MDLSIEGWSLSYNIRLGGGGDVPASQFKGESAFGLLMSCWIARHRASRVQ